MLDKLGKIIRQFLFKVSKVDLDDILMALLLTTLLFGVLLLIFMGMACLVKLIGLTGIFLSFIFVFMYAAILYRSI